MSTKADYPGIALVGLAAVALLYVVNKSTGGASASSSSAPSYNPMQGLIGANAASWFSNLLTGTALSTPSTTSITPVSSNDIASVWGNGVFQVGNQLTDPGQVTVDASSGQVSESPLSGQYAALSPLYMGFV